MADVQVGDTVWLFDSNRRTSKGTSGPVYREHFVEYKITWATSVSWVLDGNHYKIDKATFKLLQPHSKGYFGLSSTVYRTAQDVEDACWLNENRYLVSEAVRRCDDVTIMRAVAQLVQP